MRYQFEMEEFTDSDKLPRDERYDIMQYISSVRVEAEDEEQACRLLGERAHGQYVWRREERLADIKLPDYGGCVLTVRAVRAGM